MTQTRWPVSRSSSLRLRPRAMTCLLIGTKSGQQPLTSARKVWLARWMAALFSDGNRRDVGDERRRSARWPRRPRGCGPARFPSSLPVPAERPGDDADALEPADLLHVFAHPLGDAGGQRKHREQRGDAENDTRHRQEAAEFVRPDFFEPDEEAEPEVHAAAGSFRRVAGTITPSAISMRRGRLRGDLVVVGDEHDRAALLAEFAKELEDVRAGFRVEVAGRFVGEDDLRAD